MSIVVVNCWLLLHWNFDQPSSHFEEMSASVFWYTNTNNSSKLCVQSFTMIGSNARGRFQDIALVLTSKIMRWEVGCHVR